ncbi:hypothetical protein RS030_152346 [Cryptosporidium xiaoi]|uniref:Uncharacterized protein n=1 Tax=Cryptosporidium xiaoi TaxID=659607 RepID=A0AAV9Y2Z3_9CRYT
MNRIEKYINVIPNKLNIDWELLESDLSSKPKCFERIDKYIKYSNDPLSKSENVIVNLSKVFARLISIELQLYNTNNSCRRLGLFVSDSFGVLRNVDVYTTSKLIFSNIFSNPVNSISNLGKPKIDDQINSKMFSTGYFSETGFIDDVENIINNLKNTCDNITLWLIVPETTSFLNDLTLSTILEFFVDSIHFELQQKFIISKDLKISLIFILEHPLDSDISKSRNRPIVTTNQGISNIRITCINSKLLLSYSDVFISQVFDTILLRIDLSSINTCGTGFKYLTLFTQKNAYLSKFVERNFKQRKKCGNSEQNEYSDSEEGEVIDEHENIVSITFGEFCDYFFDELIDVIQLKILGKVPPQFNPTAVELLPLSSPVGRNPIKVVSSIRDSLSSESILLGKKDIPNFALIPNLKLVSEESECRLFKIEKKINVHNEFIETTSVRAPFNLSIINRDPIIPFPVSRAFDYEDKVRSTCYIEYSIIENNMYSLQSECFGELLIKIKDKIKLDIYVNCNKLLKQNIEMKNQSLNQKENIFRTSLFNLRENKRISEEITTIFSSIPSLFTQLNQNLADDFKTRSENDDLDFFKYENLEQERIHLECNFKMKSARVVDILFTKEKWGYDRRLALECFFVSFPIKANVRLNKGFIINTGLIVDNIELFFQIILKKINIFQNLPDNIGISNQDINYLIENRSFVKKYTPKIFWLSLNIFVHSLKHVSREYCRIFYILNNRNFELQNNILLPKSNENNRKVIDKLYSSDLIHIKNIYLNYNAISFTNVLEIGDTQILENKKLNYE